MGLWPYRSPLPDPGNASLAAGNSSFLFKKPNIICPVQAVETRLNPIVVSLGLPLQAARAINSGAPQIDFL